MYLEIKSVYLAMSGLTTSLAKCKRLFNKPETVDVIPSKMLSWVSGVTSTGLEVISSNDSTMASGSSGTLSVTGSAAATNSSTGVSTFGTR